eukprot:2097492-Rhodomonas_salina.1
MRELSGEDSTREEEKEASEERERKKTKARVDAAGRGASSRGNCAFWARLKRRLSVLGQATMAAV